MRSIQRAFRVTWIVLAIGIASAPAPVLAGRPDVVHQQFAYPGADLGVINICGDLADFRFWTEGSYTFVEMGDDVFHYQVVSHTTYTVTFLDTSKGVWEGTIRSATSVQATPGGTFTMAWVANSFEGPVRIHERSTFVVAGDGTIHVDHSTIDVMGCP
jgi:hypothetical protein